MKTQSGFTLVELVMIIVILGIIAASAVPKFTRMDSDERSAATQGIASALSSASSINYAVRTVKSANGVPVTSCAAVANALESALDPAYSITWKSGATEPFTTTGERATCTVTRSTGESVDFFVQAVL